MWRLPNDRTRAVITADEQINSAHQACGLKLPETAVLFFMSKGTDYLVANYDAVQLSEPFPRFLNRCPIWEIKELNLCFLDAGRGAPQAADTVETLAALGVKTIIAIGMCGAFDEHVQVGQILAPQKAFVEEGTSLHYYETIEAAFPSEQLLKFVSEHFIFDNSPIVSTDAVYRQTFAKEQLWRDKGAVAVDMESSAVFSVAKYLGMNAVALLMISDIHPIHPNSPKWEWHMTREMRNALTEAGIAIAKKLNAIK